MSPLSLSRGRSPPPGHATLAPPGDTSLSGQIQVDTGARVTVLREKGSPGVDIRLALGWESPRGNGHVVVVVTFPGVGVEGWLAHGAY